MRGGTLVFASALVLVVMLSMSSPASAITYGTQDSEHAFVGAEMVIAPDGTFLGGCSGSMVSSLVFLTSGGCTLPIYPVSQLFVTFAADRMDRNYWLPVAASAVDPLFAKNHDDPHNVGALILASPVDMTPGKLVPTAGFLDQLAAVGSLVPHQTTFQVVGYGINQTFQPTDMREVTSEGFLALEGAWLVNSMNPSLGFGGACYDDVGGPVLYTSGTTQYIVSIATIGDRGCRALDKGYRVDTAEALAFLQPLIAANP